MATLGLKEMGKFLWEGTENEGEREGLRGKITKYPVTASEIRTHDLRVTREKP